MKRRTRNKVLAIIAPYGLGDSRAVSVFLVILSSGLLLMSSAKPDMFNDVRSATMNTAGPALSAVSYPVQQVVTFVRDVSGLSSMQSRIAELEVENARLREWYQTALVLEEQNKSLKELLNVKMEPAYSYVTARIVSDSGNAFVKSLLVKVGAADDVRKGNPVVAGDGLIGRIVNTSAGFSRILLLNDMNSRIPVMVEEVDQHAILAGMNESYPVLDHISSDAELSVGMRVVTSGIGGNFPPGLPVGRVVADEQGNFRVQLFADLQKVQYVRVIQSHEDPNLVKGQIE